MHDRMAEFIVCITKNLPDMSADVVQGWTDNPAALRKLLARLCPSEASAVGFETWRTIKLGTGIKTAEAFREAHETAGCRIGIWSDSILDKVASTTEDSEATLALVNTSPADLGLKNNAKREDIHAQAFKHGLDLCPAEVGPQLRLQYLDQPEGEWLIIAMNPIGDLYGYPHSFHIEHDAGNLWLNGDISHVDKKWDIESRWIFAQHYKHH